MKTVIAIFALSGMFIGATPVMSASSFGGHTLETVAAMNVFCLQSFRDHEALGEQLTGKLKEVCEK